MTTDIKLYYCSANAHLWYYHETDEYPVFYKNLGDCSDQEVEESEERYCGCND